MEGEKLGFVGGLAADRPVLVATVLAFGSTALVAVGVNDARQIGQGSGALADLLIALLVLPVLPLALASIAPRRKLLLAGFLALIGLALLAVDAVAPSLPFDGFAPDRRLLAGAFILTLTLALAAPACGAYVRLAFLGVLGAVLGAAGAIGLLRLESAPLEETALAAGLGVALGVIVVVGVIADHATLFARGADRRVAAGRAARQTGALALYVVVIAAAAFPTRALVAAIGSEALDLAWSVGATTAFAALFGLFLSAGALSLHRASEALAVDENARVQAQRRFWRPLRKLLPVRTAYATLAVVGILIVVASFEMTLAPTLHDLAFMLIAGAAAALLFFSLRAGLFVLGAVLAASVLTLWVAELFGVSTPSAPTDTAALALAAAAFGQFALAWRDARSPRLNPRETMEAAMTDGVGRFVVSLAAGAAALYATGVSGAAPQAAAAAGYALCLGLVGGIIAPALMTALSGLVARDQF